MISNRNKLIAFFLAGSLTIISWTIIFLNIVLRITSLMQIGLYSIDILGFFITTIFLTIFTISILFKFKATSYTPVIFILLYMMSLNGTSISYFFIFMNLLIMIFLNTGAINTTNTNSQNQNRKQRYYYYNTSNQNNTNYQNNTSSQKNNNYQEDVNYQNNGHRNVNRDDIFDAEYSTKE